MPDGMGPQTNLANDPEVLDFANMIQSLAPASEIVALASERDPTWETNYDSTQVAEYKPPTHDGFDPGGPVMS